MLLHSSPGCICSTSVTWCSSVLIISKFLSPGPQVSTLNCSLIPILAKLVLPQSRFLAQFGSEGSRVAITSRQCAYSCLHLQARWLTGTDTVCSTAVGPGAQGSFWACLIYEYRHMDMVSMTVSPYITNTVSDCMQTGHSCTQRAGPTDANSFLNS